MKMKLDILKLKADDYNWACHTPQNIKDELERMLARINKELEAIVMRGFFLSAYAFAFFMAGVALMMFVKIEKPDHQYQAVDLFGKRYECREDKP
jgi:hypothetical protein